MKRCDEPGCRNTVGDKVNFCFEHIPPMAAKAETSGDHVDYYSVQIDDPTKPDRPSYMAECEDIIEALGMTFPEGEAFKSLWRNAAMRVLGKAKAGDTAIRNAEKVAFFGQRLVAIERSKLRRKSPR